MQKLKCSVSVACFDLFISDYTVFEEIAFSGGSRVSRRGGVDLRGGYVTKILYVKTKESGPVGGGACAGHAPLNPPMALISINITYTIKRSEDLDTKSIPFWRKRSLSGIPFLQTDFNSLPSPSIYILILHL